MINEKDFEMCNTYKRGSLVRVNSDIVRKEISKLEKRVGIELLSNRCGLKILDSKEYTGVYDPNKETIILPEVAHIALVHLQAAHFYLHGIGTRMHYQDIIEDFYAAAVNYTLAEGLTGEEYEFTEFLKPGIIREFINMNDEQMEKRFKENYLSKVNLKDSFVFFKFPVFFKEKLIVYHRRIEDAVREKKSKKELDNAINKYKNFLNKDFSYIKDPIAEFRIAGQIIGIMNAVEIYRRGDIRFPSLVREIKNSNRKEENICDIYFDKIVPLLGCSLKNRKH